MQDGSYHISSPAERGIYLCTDSFSASDTVRLQKHLINKMGLQCTTPKAPGKLGKAGHLRLYISARSVPRVQELVGQYMVPSMQYKIGL